MFDAGHVRDLGLPSFEDPLGPVGPGEVSGGTKAQGTPSVAAQKFQLGETGIVVSAHPGKARDLWAYLATLLSGADKGEWWRAYDSRFRKQLPALEAAEFGKLDQALFTRTFLSAGAAGSAQRQLGSKRCKLAACYAWNDGKNCVSMPCRFSYVCSRCGGDHRKSLCPPTGEGPAVTPSAV